MKFNNILYTFKHGLVGDRIIWRLGKIGVHLEPYYLIQEGTFGATQRKWDTHFLSYKTEFISEEYMKKIADYQNLSESMLIERLKDGHKCFAVKDNDEIAGYMWCDFDAINYKPSYLKLKKHEVYLYNAFVPVSYRGRNLGPFMRYRCYQELEKLNRNVFYSYSDYYNAPAVRFKQKLNARFLKLCLWVYIGDNGDNFSKVFTLREYNKPTNYLKIVNN